MTVLTTAAAGFSVPTDAAQFCARNHLLPYLEEAVRLARDSFHHLDELNVVLESDPEMGGEYVVIDVIVRGPLASVLEEYRTYTQYWVTQAPAGQQHLIRLVFDVRQDND